MSLEQMQAYVITKRSSNFNYTFSLRVDVQIPALNINHPAGHLLPRPVHHDHYHVLFFLLCHIYPGVPHQCAALFSLGLLHYMHDKTNINQHTFSYNTVTTLTTWYIHHYMHNVNYLYMFLITVVTCRCRFLFGQHYVQCI